MEGGGRRLRGRDELIVTRVVVDGEGGTGELGPKRDMTRSRPCLVRAVWRGYTTPGGLSCQTGDDWGRMMPTWIEKKTKERVRECT